MFRPESDWTGQQRFGVDQFVIDRQVAIADAAIDVRRFRWVEPSSGSFSPARHYLDYSLTPQTRRSLLKADAWSDKRYSGDILYLPPHHDYWGEPALQERRLLCVALGDAFLADLFDDDRRMDALTPCADVQSVALRRLCEAASVELMTPGFASDTLVEAMLIGIAVELVRHLRQCDTQRTQEAHGGTARQVRAVTDYVMANMSTTLGISEIARSCGMSARHVARVFKEGTGISLGEFVARSRIALAKELLAGDNLQIKEISWRCGFKSTSAFSAAFRTATGATPRAFRYGKVVLQ
jgi:AraC family transcriptional regulator